LPAKQAQNFVVGLPTLANDQAAGWEDVRESATFSLNILPRSARFFLNDVNKRNEFVWSPAQIGDGISSSDQLLFGLGNRCDFENVVSPQLRYDDEMGSVVNGSVSLVVTALMRSNC